MWMFPHKCFDSLGKKAFFYKKKHPFSFRKPAQFPLGHQPHVLHAKPGCVRAQAFFEIRVKKQSCHKNSFRFPDPDARRIIRNLLRKHKSKSAPFCISAFHPYISVHQCEEILGDCKAKPCALDIAIPLTVHLIKGLENFVNVFLFDADSGIFHTDLQADLIRCQFRVVHLHDNPALVGKLCRVICQIHKHLFDPDIIAPQLVRQIRCNIKNQFHILVLKPGHDNISHIINHGHRLIDNLVDIHSAGFYFGKIQNIINNREKRPPRDSDLFDIVFCHRRKFFPERHFRHADHRIHRRPDLMAHIGQKI